MDKYNKDNPRYWHIEIFNKDQIQNAKNLAYEQVLVGIVDENKGGIIAYAIGNNNAKKIIKALHKKLKVK